MGLEQVGQCAGEVYRCREGGHNCEGGLCTGLMNDSFESVCGAEALVHIRAQRWGDGREEDGVLC